MGVMNTVPKHVLQNQAHFVWQEALMCLKKQKERPPSRARTEAGKPKRQCEGQEVKWSRAGLSCSVLNSPRADADWEERVPLGCGSQTGSVTAAFASPGPPHSRCCPS